MSEHSDRTALLIKLTLRQSMRRIGQEAETLSQYEALAGNVGWEKLAVSIADACEALREASEKLADAVEEAACLQAQSLLSHAHEHSHVHDHPHEHPHGYERDRENPR